MAGKQAVGIQGPDILEWRLKNATGPVLVRFFRQDRGTVAGGLKKSCTWFFAFLVDGRPYPGRMDEVFAIDQWPLNQPESEAAARASRLPRTHERDDSGEIWEVPETVKHALVTAARDYGVLVGSFASGMSVEKTLTASLELRAGRYEFAGWVEESS